MKFLIAVEHETDAHGCMVFLSRLAKQSRQPFELEALTVVSTEDLVDCPDDQNPDNLSTYVRDIARSNKSVFVIPNRT